MKRYAIFAVILFFGVVTFSASNQSTPGVKPVPLEKIPPAVKCDLNFGNFPLYFTANIGQVNQKARFYAKASRYTLWLTKKGLVFDSSAGNPGNVKRDVSRLIFAGANSNPEMAAVHATGLKVNYLIGNDRSKWRGNVPTSKAVLYKNLYNKIDLKIYGIEKEIEYDWIVKPGGNPGDIRFVYKNVKGTRLDDSGNLLAETGLGELIHKRPLCYQQIGNKTVKIKGEFKKTGKNTYGFTVGNYDKQYDLIIDPVVLAYSTYLGGSGSDGGEGIAVDNNGFVYVTGYTSSTNFPVLNQYQDDQPGWDVFITKIDTGQSGMASLVYSTYAGGSNSETGNSIAVDNNGIVYVTGETVSTDFPILNQYQGDPGDILYDAFLIKLDTTQSGISSLLYSTYLGGSDNDGGFGIAVDSTGTAYITGYTWSSDFPTLNGCQTWPGVLSFMNAFVTKIDTTVAGSSGLIYSTYLGGDLTDAGFAIAADNSGIVYVTGQIQSKTGFPLLNYYQGDPGDNDYDCFVTKLDTTQSGFSSLVYSTYLGGDGPDYGYGIAVDGAGLVYITGSTSSTDFPTLAQYQSDPSAGFSDAFITKLDTTQSGTPSLLYSTYLGGANHDQGNDIAVDDQGNVYVTGMAGSADFPLRYQYQAIPPGSGTSNAFISRLNTNLSSTPGLVFSTYLGGGDSDQGHAVALGSGGNLFVTGTTYSTDFPVTNEYQAFLGGGNDAFVAKLFFLIPPTINTTPPSSITQNSAESGGNITNAGESPVTTRGVCWNTSPNPTIQDNVTDDGSGTGIFTSSLSGLTPNTVYYIRAYATSAAGTAYGHEETFETKEPFIKVTSPNGLESWEANSDRTIAWESQYVTGDVKIEYSTDQGQTWSLITTSTPNDGSHPWTVPDISSTQCLVWVGETGGGPHDRSDGFFTIFQPSITVTTPDGGEIWPVNSQKTITWTSTGAIGDVKIEYSTNNGGQWTEITSSTPNDGSYPWTIPGTESNLCLVQVSDNNGTASDKSNNVFSIVSAASLTVLSPNGGGIFYQGTLQNITWNSSGAVGNVGLQYSIDNGDNWTEITASTENDGSYPWTVPAVTSTLCRVRVYEVGENLNDSSDNVFTIQNAPVITVTSPNGSEQWDENSAQVITWTSEGDVGNVRIEYSINGGSTWVTITPSTADDGNFDWTVPEKPSNRCLVRVSASDADGLISDTSNGLFSIVAVSLGSIVVTSPNGGEMLIPGTVYPITWTAGGIAQVPVVTIEYSIDRGFSWITIAAGVANQADNSFDWSVPNTPSDNCMIRVRGAGADNAPADTGNRQFTIGSLPSTSLAVTSPNGGETWMAGDNRTITWDSGSGIGSITIEYSTDSGDNWTPVVQSIQNTGTYEWTVPDTPSAFCVVRVSDAGSGGQLFDKSDNVFSIVSPPSITVTSPNGGEQWEAGSVQTIKWTSTGLVGTVTIEYSVDGGGNWTQIASPEPNDGSYNWTVSDPPSTDCLVRIRGNDTDPNGELSDVSDSVFEVTQAGVPAITVVSPNGGERLVVDTVHEITWTSVGTVGDIDIDYSTDSGDNWAQVAQSTPNDGSYDWTVPTTPSGFCMVRVSDSGGTPLDISDAVFSIVVPTDATITVTAPNGGETFFIGDTRQITWTNSGSINTVAIQYSSDSGVTWTPVTDSTTNDGVFDWVVPDTPSGNCLVRITGVDGDWDDIPLDTSDNQFSIFASIPGALRVVSPNGGESLETGSVHNITWNSTGNFDSVKIEYSPNNGGTWLTIAESTGDTGSFNWLVPGTPSDSCLVRIVGNVSQGDDEVSDTSDAVFSIVLPPGPVITVQSPNGGDLLYIGSNYNITWTTTGDNDGEIENVLIEYSTNGGDAWQDVTGSTPNDGSFQWVVPDEPSGNCLVRISDTDGNPVDVSNAVFTIDYPPSASVRVLAPNGGETLDPGSQYTVKWDSAGVNNVLIEYSTNNGENWVFLDSVAADGGVYEWTVPDVYSDVCLVRVTGDGSGDNPSDQSDNVFSIHGTVQSSIEVLNPNGGENLGVGVEYNITWQSTGVTNVLIEYTYDNGESWIPIDTVPATGRRYTWTVPNTPSTTCRVRITGTDGGQNPTDDSDADFSIITI